MPNIETLWIITTILAVGIGGIGMLIRGRNAELRQLAETRGERIGDLEGHIQRLESRLAVLEGKYEALQAFKVQEIAEATALRVLQQLGVDSDSDL